MNSKNKKVTVDSPEYNKKSKVTFIIIMVISFAVGGFGGFFGAKAKDFFKGDLANIGEWISEKLPIFQAYVMPCLLLAFTAICTILGVMWLSKAKKLIAIWDGEDEEHISIADKYLSNTSGISSILIITIQIIFGFATYQLLELFEKVGNVYMTIITIVLYFGGMIISIMLQSATVKAIKKYAPEKKGNVYDMKFQNVWYESCDEAERHLVGEASYQTFRFMNGAFSTTLTITIIVGMFIPIGYLCTFFVGLLWLMTSCYYIHVCKKLEQGK